RSGSPSRFLTRVLSAILVKRAAIYLDDVAKLAPTQVGLLAGDPPVELRHRSTGLPQQLKRPQLGPAARSIDWEIRVARQRIEQTPRTRASPSCLTTLEHLRLSDETQAQRLAQRTGETAPVDAHREIEQGSGHRGNGDSAQLSAVAVECSGPGDDDAT